MATPNGELRDFLETTPSRVITSWVNGEPATTEGLPENERTLDLEDVPGWIAQMVEYGLRGGALTIPEANVVLDKTSILIELGGNEELLRVADELIERMKASGVY